MTGKSGGRRRWLRIGLVLLLLVLILPFGLQLLLDLFTLTPTAEQFGALSETLDGRSLGLTLVRLGVYLVVIWFGPGWYRIREEDLDRARMVLLIVAGILELVFVQRLFLI